jgi:Trypsin-co-occurring domain 2
MGTENQDDWLDLADAITLIRGQLLEAQSRVGKSPIRLTIEEVSIDIAVELEKTGGVDGSLRFGVVSASGQGERRTQGTHRVTLTLKPSRRGGGDLEVSDTEWVG